MKTRKLRLLSALLAVAMMLALLPTAAFAADGELPTSGTCGAKGNEKNVHWTLDSDGTLTISGSGAMADYDSYYNQPWAGQRDNIKHLVVENGVTSIGNNAFRYCTNLIDADMSKALSLSSISTSFWGCTGLKNVVLNEGLKEIGGSAFSFCFGTSPGSINIPSTVTAIGSWCFQECSGLENVTFAGNSQLTKIEGGTFYWCESLKKITIPKSVKLIKDDNSNGAFESSGLESVIFEPGSGLEEVGLRAFNSGKNLTIYCSDEDTNVKEALKEKWNTGNIRSLTPTVTFEVDGTEVEKQDAKENHFKAVRPGNPTKKGYVFTGWCTKNADNKYKPFDFNTTVTEDITLYAQWEEVPVDTYVVTVENGVAWVEADAETKAVAAGESICVPEGATVHVKADETAFDGMAFERWEVRKGEVKLENDRAAETTFTMPAGEVQLEAMPRLESPDDSGWDAATVVTGAVIGTGTAILAYHIGMEVYAEQVLGKDVAVPRTRGEVALLAWQLAGSPEPNAAVALLTDEAKAQQWAVESGLMQLDAEGNFHAEKKLSKWKALRTLDKAKKQV